MPWNYREVQIEDDKSIGDSGTETIDLNVTEPITALILRFKVKNDSSNLLNQPPERNISKIEIIDGGQTFWALNGQMAVAAAVNGLGRWPHHWYDERANSNQRINFPILFGRQLGDEKYAFTPSKLLNPQLRITWADQVGYLDGQHTLGVTARVMEGLSPPAEALMWREIEAWTTASAGEHKVDLPVDHSYRSLMIRAWEDDNVPSGIISNLKLDCDVGKFIPFDLASHEFRDIIKQMFGPYFHRQFIHGTSGTTRQAWMGETLSVMGSSADSAYFVMAWTAFWSYFSASVYNYDGVSGDAIAAQLLVSGLFPHSCYLYPFGRPADPETWFPASRYGEIALKLTEGSTGSTVSVAVQQPRRL